MKSLNETDRDFLVDQDACTHGAEFALLYPTIRDAWNACTRPEYLIWLLDHTKTPGFDGRVVRARVSLEMAQACLGATKMRDSRVDEMREGLILLKNWLDGKPGSREALDGDVWRVVYDLVQYVEKGKEKGSYLNPLGSFMQDTRERTHNFLDRVYSPDESTSFPLRRKLCDIIRRSLKCPSIPRQHP
jgi:hypothetical protein